MSTLNFNENFPECKYKTAFSFDEHGKRYSIKYLNVACAFDIEDSSFYTDGEKRSTMYLWSFAINDKTITGRNWNEFLTLCDAITTHYQLNERRRIIIYVHNLAHEIAFFGKRFNWVKTFSLRERRPIYAVTDNGIEFRCSYILTGLSLENLAKTLNDDALLKRIGQLDYSLIRHSQTPITEKEMDYVKTDSLIVTAYINKCIAEENGDITKIPLTKTGYARRLCRRYCLYGSENAKRDMNVYHNYRSLMSNLTLQPEEYAQLKRAFMGGFTHASCIKVQKIYHNVTSYDFTSSYPAVMVAEKFPMSRGKIVYPKSLQEFEKYCQQYCLVFNVRFKNLRSKIFYEHYLSKSKCVINGTDIIDNGRIVQVNGEVTTTITNVDWEIIKLCYDWDEVSFSSIYAYRKEYLPTNFIKPILELYKNKTELAGIKGQEDFYLRCKEILNSCYGMSVTDVIKPLVMFINGEWATDNSLDIAEEIEKYNKKKNRFLFYAWGVFVTAYARRNLWSGISHIKSDYIYADTDSVKIVNAEKHKTYFEEYNNHIVNKLEKACEYRQIPVEAIRPKTPKGVEKSLGVWSFDGNYSLFKTLGAKRYLVEYSDTKELKITVAGLGKKSGVIYLMKLVCNGKELEQYNRIKNEEDKYKYLCEVTKKRHKQIFDLFDDDLYYPKGEAGKLLLTYLDYETKGVITDYLGNVGEYHELTSVHLEPADFSLDISEEFIKFLGAINTFEQP